MTAPLPQPRHAVALAAALAVLSAGPAAAQTASSATPAAEAGQLTVITVTAERRAENIQNIPSSISTIGSELLDTLNTSGQDVRMLSGRVPSLNIESSFGRAFPRFYIRGYGNTDFRLNASQPVSLIYDDVVQENPILKGFPAFDLDRIEVLRGPQGSLFGRNTPAGVVKFESARPRLGRTEGYASVSAGTFGTVNLEGAGNIAAGPGSALRLSVMHQTRDDWVRNTRAGAPTQELEGYRDSAVRLQWLLQPGADFSALANLHARDYDGSARLFRANIIASGGNALVAGFDPKSIAIDGRNESSLRNVGANLRMRWSLGGGMALHSITGIETIKTYSRGDIDGGFGAAFLPVSGPGLIPFASETADGIPKHRQLSQELRLESDTKGPLSWQAGVFLFDEDYRIESFSYDSLAANAQDGYQRIRQTNRAAAVFGALNWSLNPQTQLRAGLRYTRDKKDLSVEAYDTTAFVPCVLSGKCTLAQLAAQEPDGRLGASPSDSKFSWDLSGTHALSKDVNLYARVATGFRGSSIQSAGPFNGKSVAGPENTTSLEAGVKADLFNRRARLNVGVFDYTVKDLQLTAVGGAGNANILLNAKKARGRGIEMDLQALLGDNLLATLGVGVNDTKIQDPNLLVAFCAQCTVTDPIVTVATPAGPAQRARIDGNPLPQAPKTTVSFTLRWSQPTRDGEIYVLTDWVYRSGVNFFLYESREFNGPSLTEGGLRVGYVFGKGKYEIAAFGRNITNQIRAVGGIDFNNNTGFINEPRTWGLQAKASF
jgi:iron complex outermembrane receptor protein